ncbi:MAG: hypothetical protein V5B34_03020 [Accumulibacter sp.]
MRRQARLLQCGLDEAFDGKHLQRTGRRIHRDTSSLGPAVGIVMVIHVHQHIDVPGGGFEDNPTPVLVDADRLQIAIPGAMDRLVMDAIGGRISLETQGPPQHLPLHRGAQGRQIRQEILRQRHLWFESRASD